MTAFISESVEQAYLSMPIGHREPALQIREMILSMGQELEATGGIEEALKWGQASYLPVNARVGSTIRVAPHNVDHLGLYFNCNTTLIETFRSLFADELVYAKNRAVLFDVHTSLPEALIRQCIRMGLYYHREKRSGIL